MPHLACLVLLAGCQPPPETAVCDVVGTAGGESLQSLYERYGTIVVVEDAALSCGCGDPRRLAGDDEGRRLAGDEEGRRLAGDEEGRRLAGDEEGRRLAGDEEGRRLAGDEEGRRLAGDGEERRLAGDEEGRRLAGDAEDRSLAGSMDGLMCREDPVCGGYLVDTNAAVRVYDGRSLRYAPDGCVAN